MSGKTKTKTKTHAHALNDLYITREAESNRYRTYRDAITALRTSAFQVESAVALIESVVETARESEHHRQRALEILIGMPFTDVDLEAAILYLERLRDASKITHALYAHKYDALLTEGF